jgi:hypothetical protein
LAELEQVTGSSTIAVTVAAASGQEASLFNRVDRAFATSEYLTILPVVSISADTFTAIARAVRTTVNVETLVNELAELTDKSNRACAFSVYFIAGSSIFAFNIEAKISFLAADSLPATSALAISLGTLSTVEALNSVADISGLTSTKSVLAFSIAIALTIVVALKVSEDILGLVSEVVFLAAVPGVTLAEFEEVAGSLTVAVAIIIASS